MNVYKFDEPGLAAWINKLLETVPVYCPAAKGEKCGTHPGWKKMTEVMLPGTGGPAGSSVKTFYFPQPEVLSTCSLKKNDDDGLLLKEPAPAAEKQVVFGVRPCDGRSVELNNLPYAEEKLFQQNRERTVLVGFSCSEPASTCFCQATGGSPYGTEGLDILISRQDDDFLVEILTDRGAEMAGEGLTPAPAAEITALEKLRAEATGSNENCDRLKNKDMAALYDAAFWNPLSESCLNCGVCTFLCPTCYCFDIQDEALHGKTRRIRYWDSCMFPLYTLHTTGHNPRGRKVQRVRNRFMHKLKNFPDRFGPLSCVGCGRCVVECPVNIDIREVVTDLLAVE